ncbi:polysaccharide deacetylase family protein [Streptomyces nodosus]
MRRLRPAVAAGAVLTLLVVTALATGCSAGEHDRHGRGLLNAPEARALDAYATRLGARYAERAVAAERWALGRVPPVPPSAPARKPPITFRKGFEVEGGKDLPPVFTTVPTRNKIVFLTVDEGTEKDPEFLRMMSELKVPYSAFLSDDLINDDYDYFRRMRDLGVTLNNDTLHTPYLPGMPYEEQRQEICGMQDVMAREFGRRPTLFRPPNGVYDADALRAAKSCGIRYAPIWNEEVFADRWEYREWDHRLHPGDIVLAHLRGGPDGQGTTTDAIRRFLDRATDEGYAVARLEDYL